MKQFEDVKKTVVSLSGGLDSTTLLHLAVSKLDKENVYALSFNYNQQHSIELTCAKRTCADLGVQHKIIDIGFLGEISKGVSAMVKGGLPTPSIEDVNASKEVSTYVPFRNMILSGITFAYAESVGADSIALGVQYGDYENAEAYFYWDTSAKFTQKMQEVADLNNKHSISYVAPFVSLRKEDEIRLGQQLSVDYGNTWTCYAGKVDAEASFPENESAGGMNFRKKKHYQPCGVCPSCIGRADAFAAVGMKDPCVEHGVWED